MLEPNIKRGMFILVIIGLAGMMLLGLLVKSGQKTSDRPPAPQIPDFPEAINPVHHPVDGVMMMDSLTFSVQQNFDSTGVYKFYKSKLEKEGYTPAMHGIDPFWQPGEVRDGMREITYHAAWADPQKLYVMDLYLIAREKIIRDKKLDRVVEQEIQPGLDVKLTLMRKVIID